MKKMNSGRRTFTRRQVGKGLAAGLVLGGIPTTTPAANRSRLEHSRGRTAPRSAGLGTLTLVNDSKTRRTNIGTPTRIFGWPFAAGQLPAGHVPVFTGPNGPIPFSANPKNACRYWPDGSLMFCAFALLPNFTVKPGGSQAVTITDGGPSAWPTASRSVTNDLYPQALTINAPMAPISFDANTRWGAWLTRANASNIVKARTWLVGPAGDCWGFTVNLSQSEGGTPHGLLACNFVVHALTDGSGNLGGFRFWADLRQPYYDNTRTDKGTRIISPPNAASPSSGLNYSIGGTAHAAPNWPFPATALPFSSDANNNMKFKSASPTYFGGGGDLDVVGAIVTPGTIRGLLAGGFWLITASDHLSIRLASAPNLDGSTEFHPTGAGSGTLLPVPMLQPFQMISIGGADGEYISFQGVAAHQGSIAADVPLRSGLIDLAHWVKSRLIPSYDTTQTGTTFGGQIFTISQSSGYEAYWNGTWNNIYNPFCRGPMNAGLSAAGNGAYIAPFPVENIYEAYNGTLNDYTACLFEGLSQGLTLGDVVNAGSPTVPINLSPNSYAGMGASSAYWQGGGRGGIDWSTGPYTAPANNGGNYAQVGYNEISEHWPMLPGWAYLRTGRLELLDRVVQNATLCLENTGRGFATLSEPYPMVITQAGSPRGIAWRLDKVIFAAIVYPSDPSGLNNSGVTFDGSRTDQYLQQQIDPNFQLMVDVVDPAYKTLLYPSPPNPANVGRYVTGTTKNWLSVVFNSGHPRYNGANPWEVGYVGYCACWALAGLGSRPAATFLQNFAKSLDYWQSDLGGYGNLYSYNYSAGPECGNQSRVFSAGLWGDDAHYLVSGATTWTPGGGVVDLTSVVTPNPSPRSRAFTVGATGGHFGNNYVPANGDYLMWGTGEFEGATIFNATISGSTMTVLNAPSQGGGIIYVNDPIVSIPIDPSGSSGLLGGAGVTVAPGTFVLPHGTNGTTGTGGAGTYALSNSSNTVSTPQTLMAHHALPKGAGFTVNTVYQMIDVTSLGGGAYSFNLADLSGTRIPVSIATPPRSPWNYIVYWRDNQHNPYRVPAFGPGAYIPIILTCGQWAKAALAAQGLTAAAFDAVIADALKRWRNDNPHAPLNNSGDYRYVYQDFFTS